MQKVPTTSQFFDFVYCIAFDLISFRVTAHTLYNIGQLTKCDAPLISFRYTSYQIVTSSHGIVRTYSVAALVLTIKPRQTYTQCYRVIQLRSVSIQQEGLKEEIFT